MRPLRWKSRYLTGYPGIDARSRALLETLNETAADAKRVEHCQDFEAFSARIAGLGQDLPEQLRGAGGFAVFTRALQQLLLQACSRDLRLQGVPAISLPPPASRCPPRPPPAAARRSPGWR